MISDRKEFTTSYLDGKTYRREEVEKVNEALRTINKSDRTFQTMELSQADDFITGNRLYKLLKYTRNSAGKIIKKHAAEPVRVDWREVPEGGSCPFILQFEGTEMEDTWRGGSK